MSVGGAAVGGGYRARMDSASRISVVCVPSEPMPLPASRRAGERAVGLDQPRAAPVGEVHLGDLPQPRAMAPALNITLPAGHCVLYCSLYDHEALGMSATNRGSLATLG